jgi:hypothetical protein
MTGFEAAPEYLIWIFSSCTIVVIHFKVLVMCFAGASQECISVNLICQLFVYLDKF